MINIDPLNKATNHIFLPIAEHCSYGPFFICEDHTRIEKHMCTTCNSIETLVFSVRAILLKRSFSVHDMRYKIETLIFSVILLKRQMQQYLLFYEFMKET